MKPIYSQGFHAWLGAEFGADALSRLDRFASDLLRFNRAQNLVSRVDPEVRVGALVEECALAFAGLGSSLGRGGRWVDVGSGGGLPGLVWACLDPVLEIDLIERRRGRCDFLRREVSALELSAASVIEGDGSGDDSLLGSFALATAKAVTPPPEVFELLDPLVSAPGHIFLFHRHNWSLEQVAPGWSLDSRFPLVFDGGGPDAPEGYLFHRA